MIKLRTILESISFSNWKRPSISDLKREYRVEHELKGLNYFESEADFLKACKNGNVVKITKSMNSRIQNRSNTSSFEELLSLIKTYRSYPKYRNEKTLKSIYDGFKKGESMDLPIIIDEPKHGMRVFSGNTRLDIAFQLGITPMALILNTEGEYD